MPEAIVYISLLILAIAAIVAIPSRTQAPEPEPTPSAPYRSARAREPLEDTRCLETLTDADTQARFDRYDSALDRGEMYEIADLSEIDELLPPATHFEPETSVFVEYIEPEPVSRYPAITDEEFELLVAMVFHEARGETPEGQQAAAEVALNRLISERFQDTVHDVIFAQGQFAVASYIYTGTPTETQHRAVYAALYGEPVLSEDYVFFNTHPITQRDVVWIGNHAFSK